MDLNAITADLKFVGSYVQRIQLNNNHPLLNGENVSYGFDVEVVLVEKDESKESWTGTVVLAVGVSSGAKDKEKQEFVIEYQVEGSFAAPLSIDEQDFVNMLYVNGGTALYSIARADLLAISSLALHGGNVRIPMINMLEFLEEKARNAQTEETDQETEK